MSYFNKSFHFLVNSLFYFLNRWYNLITTIPTEDLLC
nr:MAG TPA: hypothetical protein [Caudoviricetes sp.]